MDRPSLSFIVCTRNRQDKLLKMLASLDQRELRNLGAEIVFIDNASTDDTQKILRTFAADAYVPVTIVREETVNHAAAKNRGLLIAKGDAVLFGDDDCLFTKGYFTKICDALKTYDYAGGAVQVIGNGDPVIGSTLGSVTKVLKPRSMHPAGTIMGASMAFRRTVIDTLGPFDLRFFDTSKEIFADDSEYLSRASTAGFTGIFLADAIALHAHDRSSKAEIAGNNRVHDRGRGAIFRQRIAEGHRQYVFLWATQSIGRFFRRGLRRGWNAFSSELAGFFALDAAKGA